MSASNAPRHLLDMTDLDATEIHRILDLAEVDEPPQVLEGSGGVLMFEKASARTRASVEMAVAHLGGHPVSMRGEEVGIDVRESAEDLARLYSGYGAFIGARVYEHSKLERMAAVATVPVINLLSDDAHPVQTLADLLTIRQEFGTLDDLTVAYVGDANNVARSLALGVHLVGSRMRIAHPDGYGFSPVASAALARAGCPLLVTQDPAVAVSGADVVYTDAWYSMGQEVEAATRRPHFEPFRVTQAMLGGAAPHAVFLHCLPAHRGDEATDDVLDGSHSRIWPQAHNRLHATRGLLLDLAGVRP